MKENFNLEILRSSLTDLCNSKYFCNVTAWIDVNEKKKKIIFVLQTFSYVISSLVFFLVILIVALYQIKSIIEKKKTINILKMTGYEFNKIITTMIFTSTLIIYLFSIGLVYVLYYIIYGDLVLDLLLNGYKISFLLCLMSAFFSLFLFKTVINR